MSPDGVRSVPSYNWRLLGRRNSCPVGNIIEGPSVKYGIFEVTILLTSHLAHQSKERMPLFLVNANYSPLLC